MSYRFVNEPMRNVVKNVIKETYPKIPAQDLSLLEKYFVPLVECIAKIMGMDHKVYVSESITHDQFVEVGRTAFYQDNNKWIRWLLQYILPYTNESNGKTKLDLETLADIYTKKVDPVDINKKEPRYMYSNIQYGRCNRDNPKAAREIAFSEKHIAQNYYLLIDTLRECCHKMHVNWKDILPFSTRNFEDSRLYKETAAKVEDGSINDWNVRKVCNPENFDGNVSLLQKHTKSLYIGTIYDVVSNMIYENILPVKWMIYNVKVSSRFNTSGHYPMMSVLNEFLDIDFFESIANPIGSKYPAHRKTYWNDTIPAIQKQFEKEWQVMVNAFLDEIVPPHDDLEMTPDAFSTMMKSIIIGFNFGYSKIGLLEKSKRFRYIPLNLKDEMAEDDEDMKFYSSRRNELKLSLFRKTVKSIQASDLYDYLMDAYEIYMQSVFYRMGKIPFYIDEDGNDYSDEGSKKYGPVVKTVYTQKNFYNYCKSLVHYTVNGEFTRLPRFWRSMTPAQRSLFKFRLTNKNNAGKWFNVARYIRSYYAGPSGRYNVTSAMAERTNNSLFNYSRRNVVKLVFHAMIKSGTFTYYYPCLDAAEQYKKSFAEKEENPFWGGSYHYLTGTAYKIIPTDSYFGMGEEKRSVFNYQSSTKHKWYTLISPHWIAQLGLCHRIIQNRVHFITGGTGIGKSSIVPMLYLYYLKSISYKLHGRVVCTFPRIQPTEETARNISSQMGLPIKGNDDKYNNHNYDVHVITGDRKYRRDGPGLKLICTTDGSMLMNLTNNPMLKTSRGSYMDDYTIRNMYDVVIVDEAHEHNANMDIILTLMRNVSYHNNSITTVIMSATIDDDEPTYRRVYRDINDNRKYPLDRNISINREGTGVGVLDRINCDRRLHIADPDAGTNFPITEYYVPDADPGKLSVQLFSKTKRGFLLMFQPGSREIMENVEFINQNTSRNIIALPFYAGLGKIGDTDNGVKELVKGVDETLRTIRIGKDEDLHTAGKEGAMKGNGFYNQCAIVATNIAEASITIKNLVFVVETGQQKVSKFDRKIRDSSLVVEGITESSRLQRRGRVGRSQPGTVYYVYEKDTMKENKIQYGIAVQDVTDSLVTLMQNNSNEVPFINIDVNNPASMTPAKVDALTRGFDKIIRDLYFVGDDRYDYVGDETQYDYQNNKRCPMYYQTGYRYARVIDSVGTFYVIHPDELLLRRNITGEIVDVINSDPGDPDIVLVKNPDGMNYTRSEKIKVFLQNLMRFMLITFDGNKSVKTEIGKYIGKITGTLQRGGLIDDTKKTMMLMYGYVFGCVDEIIAYLAMSSGMRGNMKNGIFVFDESIRAFNKDKMQRYIRGDGKSSDILALVEFARLINDHFARNNRPLDHRSPIYLKQFEQQIGQSTAVFIKRVMSNSEEYIDNENAIGAFEDYLSFVGNMIREKKDGIVQNIVKLINLPEETVSNYCEKVVKLRGYIDILNIKDSRQRSKTLEELSVDLRPLTELVQLNNVNDRVTAALLLANPYNLARNIDNAQNRYLNVFSPRLSNTKKFASLFRSRYISSCLMSDAYLKSYIYYDSFNTVSREMAIGHRVEPRFLGLLSHVTIPREIISLRDDTFNPEEMVEWDDNRAVTNYKRTFDSIVSDVKKYRSGKIWKILPLIDPLMRDYANMMSRDEVDVGDIISRPGVDNDTAAGNGNKI